MAVHHVHMEHAAAGRLERGNLLAQTRKIGRKDGWQDLNHGRLPLSYNCGEEPVPGVAAGQPEVRGGYREAGDYIFVFFPFERAGGVDQRPPGLRLWSACSRILRCRSANRARSVWVAAAT